MASKKQRALKLAKTEARLSGIPKGGSTRTSMTKAEKIAYELALSTLGVSAAALGTKALIKAGTELLAKKTAQKQAIKKGRATTAAKRAEGEAEKTGEYWSKLQDKAVKQKPKSPKKGSMENPWRLVGDVEDSHETAARLLGEVIKKRKPRKKIVGLLKQRSEQEYLRSMTKQQYISKTLAEAKKYAGITGKNVDKSKWKEIETLAEKEWLKANKRPPTSKKKGGVVKKKVKKGYTKKYANGGGVRKARR